MTQAWGAGQIWSSDRIEKLRTLHAQGLSCALIAAEIGGVSRNAIIGKLHRLGLSNAKSIIRKVGGPPRSEKPKIEKTMRVIRANGNSDKMRFMESPKIDVAPLRCVEVVPLNVSLLDLADDGCRYPYGDGAFTFCGHPQIEGSSYCGPHWAVTFTPARGSNPAAAERRRRNLLKQRTSHLVEAFA